MTKPEPVMDSGLGRPGPMTLHLTNTVAALISFSVSAGIPPACKRLAKNNATIPATTTPTRLCCGTRMVHSYGRDEEVEHKGSVCPRDWAMSNKKWTMAARSSNPLSLHQDTKEPVRARGL